MNPRADKFLPVMPTGLPNEDVEDGKCERCATAVVKNR